MLNTIKSNPNTNSWKNLQEESLGQERLGQHVFLKNFKQNSSRHLSVKQKYKRLHTINKKYVHKERKKTVRTYVFFMLRIYVMILCNWLILWQNALYLYLGRLRMCLNTSRNHVSRSSIEIFKSVQEIKQRVQFH